MSRLPLPSVSPTDKPPSSTPADDDTEYVALNTTARETVSAADLESACASSLELIKLRSIISKDWSPSPKGLEPDLLPYHKIRHELSVKDNYVFRGFSLLVPGTLRHAVISIANDSHQGAPRPQSPPVFWAYTSCRDGQSHQQQKDDNLH